MDLPPPPSNTTSQRPPFHIVATQHRDAPEIEKPSFRAPDLEPLLPRVTEKSFKRRPFKPLNRR